jgi:lycopene cyclase domain-containing protein
VGVNKVLHEEQVKEYTLFSVLAAMIVVALDLLVIKTRILRQSAFWIFLLVMFAFKTIVNGYLTWRPIVIYGEKFNLGVRIVTIPVEDYIFGFTLIALSTMLWEYFKQKEK